MGKRGWVFKCMECNCEFSRYFEWIEASKIQDKTNNIVCEHCKSKNWKITNRTSFAGGIEQKASEIGIKCKGCYSRWYVQFGDLTKHEIQELGENLKCVDCDNSNPVITDEIKN